MLLQRNTPPFTLFIIPKPSTLNSSLHPKPQTGWIPQNMFSIYGYASPCCLHMHILEHVLCMDILVFVLYIYPYIYGKLAAQSRRVQGLEFRVQTGRSDSSIRFFDPEISALRSALRACMYPPPHMACSAWPLPICGRGADGLKLLVPPHPRGASEPRHPRLQTRLYAKGTTQPKRVQGLGFRVCPRIQG